MAVAFSASFAFFFLATFGSLARGGAAAGAVVKRPNATLLPRFVVDRGHAGHSGSNWLATLLSGSGVSTYFQFGGSCAAATPDATGAAAALTRLVEGGCECADHAAHGWPVRCTNTKYETCLRTDFCEGRCTHERASGCAGVATVAPPVLPTEDLVRLAVKLRFRYVAWIRSNCLKQAVSKIKAFCTDPSFKNHMSAAEVAKLERQSSYAMVSVNPLILLAATTACLENNANFEAQLKAHGPRVAHVAYYEDLQVDTQGEFARLLSAVGVVASPSSSAKQDHHRHMLGGGASLARPSQTLLSTTTKKRNESFFVDHNKEAPRRGQRRTLLKAKTELVKSAREDLEDLLVNMKEIEAIFQYHDAKCALAMLKSAKPEKFDCGPDERFPTYKDFVDTSALEPYSIDCRRKKCQPARCGHRDDGFDAKHQSLCDRVFYRGINLKGPGSPKLNVGVCVIE